MAEAPPLCGVISSDNQAVIAPTVPEAQVVVRGRARGQSNKHSCSIRCATVTVRLRNRSGRRLMKPDGGWWSLLETECRLRQDTQLRWSLGDRMLYTSLTSERTHDVSPVDIRSLLRVIVIVNSERWMINVSKLIADVPLETVLIEPFRQQSGPLT